MKARNSSGPAIKGIASAIMHLGMIGSFVAAAVLAFVIGGAMHNMGIGIIIFLAVFGLGALFSWLGTRLLQGFGELVEYTADTANYLDRLVSMQKTGPGSFAAKAESGFQIEDDVLVKYTSSRDVAVIPYGVTEIGCYAFANCTQLTDVVIPESVKIIRDGAFFRCIKLTSITIPGSVASIGLCTFSECSALKKITIPPSVTSITDFAFRDSHNVIICGVPGSTAELYARKCGIPFIAEGEDAGTDEAGNSTN